MPRIGMDISRVVTPPVAPVDEATGNAEASSCEVPIRSPVAHAHVANVCPRQTGMGNNTIKNHLVLHICKDILGHGVPENMNSAYAESVHIPVMISVP
jgi:hypothetical protein